ncbi:MAG: hypothetical protein AAB269_02280, partial [Bacteroidota bacterium]
KLRIPARFAFTAMLCGWGVSTVSLVYGRINSLSQAPQYLLGIEPMYPGLLVSLLVWGAGKFARE